MSSLTACGMICCQFELCFQLISKASGSKRSKDTWQARSTTCVQSVLNHELYQEWPDDHAANEGGGDDDAWGPWRCSEPWHTWVRWAHTWAMWAQLETIGSTSVMTMSLITQESERPASSSSRRSVSWLKFDTIHQWRSWTQDKEEWIWSTKYQDWQGYPEHKVSWI